MRIFLFIKLFLNDYFIWRYIRRISISAGQIKKKKQSVNIKREEINIINIIDNIALYA